MDLYISQLLYRYQCVTVPGFGAFLTEIQSAHLNESTHSFYPPKKLVSFNSYLKNNDGLLANHMAQSEKISYDAAVSIIENQVVNWKSKLQDLETISLKNIGEFSLNTEKSLVFTPFDSVNYLTESFGLTTYVSPAIKREVLQQVAEIEEETEVVQLVPETRSNPFLKYAAIFVISAGLLGAGGVLGNNYYQQKIQEETLAVQTKVQKQVEQKIQEATFVISNPIPAVTLTVNNAKTPYHIVAGAFLSEENADKMYEELIHLGYPAQRIRKNQHGLYPVIYRSYASYSEAQTEMQRIKKSHNPEAWVLIEEL
jgi:nucleoid DNA-binding protein